MLCVFGPLPLYGRSMLRPYEGIFGDRGAPKARVVSVEKEIRIGTKD